jgi:hypothetical protein
MLAESWAKLAFLKTRQTAQAGFLLLIAHRVYADGVWHRQPKQVKVVYQS